MLLFTPGLLRLFGGFDDGASGFLENLVDLASDLGEGGGKRADLAFLFDDGVNMDGKVLSFLLKTASGAEERSGPRIAGGSAEFDESLFHGPKRPVGDEGEFEAFAVERFREQGGVDGRILEVAPARIGSVADEEGNAISGLSHRDISENGETAEEAAR